MKIIPNGAPRPAHGLPYALPQDYAGFLAQYDGGFVFPNHIDVADPTYTETTGDTVVAIQFFYGRDKIEEELARARANQSWPEGLLPIATVSGGDEVLMSIGPDRPGSLWLWARVAGIPFGDEENNHLAPLAANFTALLAALRYDPDLGLTPPWRRMASPDEAPAIDLVLAP